MSTHTSSQRLTSLHVREVKGQRKLVMITAYDYPSALFADAAGIDILLVGDSVGMAVLGHEDTLGVTLEQMLHHCRAVSQAQTRALVVGDMPFMTYECDVPTALCHAGRLVSEGGVRAVKLEGGRHVLAQVQALVAAGIPVMGHLGLTPQRMGTLGGFRVQGRTARAAQEIMYEAKALQDAGCFALVLECVPQELAALITEELTIPTIGIGAGSSCDGQVLVLHDMLGMNPRHSPRFVKKYADMGAQMTAAVAAYAEEVRQGTFPGTAHSFRLEEQEMQALQKILSDGS